MTLTKYTIMTRSPAFGAAFIVQPRGLSERGVPSEATSLFVRVQNRKRPRWRISHHVVVLFLPSEVHTQTLHVLVAFAAPPVPPSLIILLILTNSTYLRLPPTASTSCSPCRTKFHSALSNGGLLFMLGGQYAIYTNKERMGKPHFTSWHSYFGLLTLALWAANVAVAGTNTVDFSNKRLVFLWRSWSHR